MTGFLFYWNSLFVEGYPPIRVTVTHKELELLCKVASHPEADPKLAADLNTLMKGLTKEMEDHLTRVLSRCERPC